MRWHSHQFANLLIVFYGMPKKLLNRPSVLGKTVTSLESLFMNWAMLLVFGMNIQDRTGMTML